MVGGTTKSIRSFCSAVEQASRFDLQRCCELLDDPDRRVAAPAFDVADISAVDAGAIGIVLLAPALLLTEATNIPAKARAYIHGQLKRPMSLIVLQTISDKELDLCGLRTLLVSLICDDTRRT